MSGVIDRPDVDFEAVEHVYSIEGRKVSGVSSVAKMGSVDDTWGIASAWGFRLGYEGALDVVSPLARRLGRKPTPDELRAELQEQKRTPWGTRDAAQERGSWVHDTLEALAQDGTIPDLSTFPEEVAGHVRSCLRWYLHFRPSFVATEVQVASRTHHFAGRYDVRAKIEARLLVPLFVGHETPQAERVRELAEAGEWALCLIDLKTSKRVYPTTHFPQLAGYELAGVEMRFPATDAQLVLNTWPTGEHEPTRDFVASWAQGEDFLDLLTSYRAMKDAVGRLKAADPEEKRKAAVERVLLDHLPAMSRDLAQLPLPELEGMDAKAVGRALGRLRKAGKVTQERGTWSLAV